MNMLSRGPRIRSGAPARAQGESVHKAQTSDHLDPLLDRDGGGRGGRGRSVHRRAVAL